MSRTFTQFFLSLILLFSMGGAFAQTTVSDSVVLGASYDYQVFYNLETGTKDSAVRNDWDIAFQANGLLNGGIWFNESLSQTAVYQIPGKDSSDFGTLIDTTGFATWQRLQNGSENWAQGAFNANKSSSNAFDYGWGVYSGGAPHNVVGDSLYLLRLSGGVFKVLFIEQLNGYGGYYKFRFSDVDGSNVVVDSVSKNNDRNLVYYNLRTATAADREPGKNDWQLLFTTGLRAVSSGQPGAPLSAPAGTVYTNDSVYAVKIDGMPSDSADYTQANFANQNIFAIGSAYRIRITDVNHPFGGYWDVADSTTYFVKIQNGNIYKVVFTQFSGSAPAGNGLVGFDKTLVYEKPITGIAGVETASRFILYPNPAIDQLNIVIDANEAGMHQVTVTDLTGKVAYTTSMPVNGLQNIVVPVSNLANGYYLVSVEANGNRSVQKFVKQ